MTPTPLPDPHRTGFDFTRFVRSWICRLAAWGVIVTLVSADVPLSLTLPDSEAASLLFGPADFIREQDNPHRDLRLFTLSHPPARATLCLINGGQAEQVCPCL